MDNIDETYKEKLKHEALNSAEMLKNAPEWMQNYNLLRLCKTDKTGRIERVARIIAKYGVKPEEVIPCIMDLMIEFMQ